LVFFTNTKRRVKAALERAKRNWYFIVVLLTVEQLKYNKKRNGENRSSFILPSIRLYEKLFM